RVDNLEGDEAAKRIAGWHGIQLSFSPLPAENRKYRVHTDVLSLARAAWEKGARPGHEKQKKEKVEGFAENIPRTRLEEAIYKHASIIRSAKGYRGMAVTNSGGGLLASDIISGTRIDFSSMAQAINSMYAECSKHWNRKGLGSCKGLSLHTDQGIIIMQGTNMYTSGNYRFIVLVAEGGNSFFVQTQLKSAIPKILSEIS
ncbi:MAG: hypothetical protein ACOCQI_06420, partial [Desulfosalsimonas sp.]